MALILFLAGFAVLASVAAITIAGTPTKAACTHGWLRWSARRLAGPPSTLMAFHYAYLHY